MNYADYRQFRDRLLTEKRPLRLDCMNPRKALAPWAPPASSSAVGIEAALDGWRRATGRPTDCIAVGAGVRDLLTRLMPSLTLGAEEVWLPEDVYPVYWSVTTGENRHAFRTLPEVDWRFLESSAARAIALLPLPLAPLGRLPSADEVDRIVSWLNEAGERLLVVDAVYAYQLETLSVILDRLIGTGRCIVLWSCAKGWLTPDALGIAELPPSLRTLDAGACAPEPLARALGALETAPRLPLRQQQAFAAEWRRLAPSIQATTPQWQPPSTGYFSVVPVAFETLLSTHNLLGVPATVFGSKRHDCTVVTCLHDLMEHHA